MLAQGQSQYSMARQNARGDLTEVLDLVCEPNVSNSRPTPKRADVLRLIDHFVSEKHPWIGTPATQKAFQKHGMRLGVDAPHLLHAIMAFSAAHIDHLDPNPALRLTAVHHYGRLVELYADHMKQLGTGTVNHLFGTCILLTMLSYLVVGYDNPDLLCNPEEHECNWDAFRSLGGVRIMQGVPAYRAELTQGAWSIMLQEAVQWEEKTKREHMVTPVWWNNLLASLCDLCNVSPDLKQGDDIYLEPLRGLNKIVYGSLDDTKVGQLMHFIGRLSPAFQQVLEQLDPRAMLIILYWHSFLLLIGQWWAARTGIVASRRTIAFLWKVGGVGVRKLLVFPAALCGLDLQSLDQLLSNNQEIPISVSPFLEAQRTFLS
jgi:hypothetical protein